MTQANSKKELLPSQVRLVVEVDGHPVGFLNLDLDRLWPLINHRKRDVVPVEWMDATIFDSIMRAVVMKRLMSRLQGRLYQTLGDEMVKAELDVEIVTLKAETAAQVFGRTKTEIEKFVADSGGTAMDFYTFFWEYLLEDREVTDLKKEWKTRDIPTR
ncbi:MAG: hypothetical protein DMG14_09940 [Acidobacteria bacterium]|nr:MAG: hypothetical protein DMG14_09940 [Acidobacteriota bacterium]